MIGIILKSFISSPKAEFFPTAIVQNHVEFWCQIFAFKECFESLPPQSETGIKPRLCTDQKTTEEVFTTLYSHSEMHSKPSRMASVSSQIFREVHCHPKLTPKTVCSLKGLQKSYSLKQRVWNFSVKYGRSFELQFSSFVAVHL